MNKQQRHAKPLIKIAEAHGATIRENHGKVVMRFPDGKVITLHGTPSDRRNWKNFKAQWTQYGLEWPHRGEM